jgi:hypothetical protein
MGNLAEYQASPYCHVYGDLPARQHYSIPNYGTDRGRFAVPAGRFLTRRVKGDHTSTEDTDST